MINVWAPKANSLVIEINNELKALDKRPHGWWVSAQDLRDGDDYLFIIDGKVRAPDPRSPRQPAGVHGPSRYVDHSLFKWSDQHWQAKPLSAAIIYELHVGTFTDVGTFDAAIDRLDHLVDLGITHVELMPIASFQGSRGWGYDGVALYAPHEAYGGPTGLKRLVDACHAKKLAVILDVVYNHLGPSGNYLPQFGPYFSEVHSTPWGNAINFDGPDSDEVRRFFCDNALMWLRDYHFDGLRLDAVHAILDTSAIPFLEQLAGEVRDLEAHLGRHFVLVAESDLNDPRVIRSPAMGGYGIQAQWSDDIHHSLHTVLTREAEGYYEDFGSLEHLCTSMERPYVYAGRHSKYRRRTHGRAPLGLHGHQFVAYLQNHDQLGNRARGERLCQLTNIQRVKIGAALIMTSPYVPMLFQGEEWAARTPFLYFVDFDEEPELAKAVAEGRRREFESFGWDPESIPDPTCKSSFIGSKLPWDELNLEQHADMLRWYKALISLRRNLSPLTNGRLEFTNAQCSTDDEWLIVERGPILVAANLSNKELTLTEVAFAESSLLLASEPSCCIYKGRLQLAPESVAIIATTEAQFRTHSASTSHGVTPRRLLKASSV